MSKCLKCGAELPEVGECTACITIKSPPAFTSSLLNKDIRIDRRTPERTPAVPGPAAVPSFAELAPPSPASPPGMIPRQAAPSPAPAPALEAPRSVTPPAFPKAELPPAAAAQAPATALPPDLSQMDTLPGAPAQVPDAAPPPALSVPAPTAMASAAQLPPQGLGQTAAPVAHASAPATGGLPRPVPTPVPVVTFNPPARTPPAHASEQGAEPHTPRLPIPAQPPSAASAARTATAAGVRNAALGEQEIHARPASLWRRLLSFTIDSATIVGVSALYITLASSITGLKAPSSQGLTFLDTIAAWMNALQSVLLPGAILVLVLATVYCAVAAFLWNGRTLGRMVLGLRLVDTHGLAPAPARAIVRALLSVVSFGLFLGGFWMALFDRRGQTLHDKLTSTFVVQPS
ncbi:MAG TPA: RDD family protein [Myxococcaceae bacterium]